MEERLKGFAHRATGAEMAATRYYVTEIIEKSFQKKATEQAIELGMILYMRGVDDQGGAMLCMADILRKRKQK